MGDMTQAEERNKIKLIEGLTCDLTNNVKLTLTKASGIDVFFFGTAVAEKKLEAEVPVADGWLSSHIRVLGQLNDRLLGVCGALENLHQLVKK